MPYLVRYYLLPQGEVTSRHVGIAVVFGQWPARVLKHRGYRADRQVALRVTTPAEDEHLKSSTRHQAYFYPSVDGLVRDEHAVLDRDGFNRLMRSLQVSGIEVESAVAQVLSMAH